MRRFLTVLLLCAPLAAGCGLVEKKRYCGVHFEILLPPVIDTNTPVLVQNSGQSLTAHPMGTLAGPVLQGQAIHGPSAPMQMAPAQMPAGRPGITFDPCGPLMPQSLRLTVDEYQRLQQQVAKPLPRPSGEGQEE